MMHTERRAMAAYMKRCVPSLTVEQIARHLNMTTELVERTLRNPPPREPVFAAVARAWSPDKTLAEIVALSGTSATTVHEFQRRFGLQGKRLAA